MQCAKSPHGARRISSRQCKPINLQNPRENARFHATAFARTDSSAYHDVDDGHAHADEPGLHDVATGVGLQGGRQWANVVCHWSWDLERFSYGPIRG